MATTAETVEKYLFDESIEQLIGVKFWTLVMLTRRGFDPNKFDDIDRKILKEYPDEALFRQSLESKEDRNEFLSKMFQEKVYMSDLNKYKPYKCEARNIILESMDNPSVDINVVIFDFKDKDKQKQTSAISGKMMSLIDKWPKGDTKILTIITNSPETRTKVVKAAINDYPAFHVQSFMFEEMLYSRIFLPQFLHFFLPFTYRLNDKEKKDLEKDLAKSGWTPDHLEKYLHIEPVPKYNGYLPGDIIKQIRLPTSNDSFSGIEINYRVVIDGVDETNTTKPLLYD